jgi:hypothetical protein
MSYSNVYQPCEHVTLYLTGINNTDEVDGNGIVTRAADNGSTKDKINYHFDIPASKYFSQDRGSLCTIQVVTGTYQSGTNHICASYFLMSDSPNGFTVTNPIDIQTKDVNDNTINPPLSVPDSVCIAMACEQNGNTGGEIRGTGEFLVAARPEKLHIKAVYTSAETSKVCSPPTQVCHSLALKFTYYDPVQSTVNMKNHQDYRQLKGGRSSYI